MALFMSNYRQALPIGIDDFKELREKNYFFVDKTLFIKELLDLNCKVLLLLRPRRFGKTLHLSMLKYFFDVNEKNKKLFNHLAINQAGEKYLSRHQKHPVIFLTFKNIKATQWSDAYGQLQNMIIAFYNEHSYLLTSPHLHQQDKNIFKKIINKSAEYIDFQSALKNLTEYLAKHFGVPAYALIDEYDSPIHEAYQYGYADEMLVFLRSFLGESLKGNSALEQAVVTGILRIAKESLFSGVNNLATYSVIDNRFSDYFGWTEREVKEALSLYGLAKYQQKAALWYDGYTVGNAKHLYNPWSVMNFIANDGHFRAYWVNTGNSAFLQKILAESDMSVKVDLEKLLNEEVLDRPIDDSLTLLDLSENSSLWTQLLLAGYLTALPKTSSDEENTWPLKIPNAEVNFALRKIIKNWFMVKTSGDFLQELLSALISGDIVTFRAMIIEYIEEILSYFDVKGNEPERFYHALILGMLVTLKDTHTIRSNRESGFGRYDVMLIPYDRSALGIVIEFKKILKASNDTLDTAIERAFRQIEEKNYQQQLKNEGIKNILAVAMAFSGKAVAVEGKRLC